MGDLDPFFNPKSVAIIGASHTPGKIGYVILSNFLGGAYEGKVYPINPNTAPILGREVYGSILKVPDKIDLAVVAIPAKIVPKVLRRCVKKGVKAVIIISAGFSEIGDEGKKLEDRCKKIVDGTKTRVLGPNVIGVYDPISRVDTLFLSRERCGRPKRGKIAFITQSGAVGSTILDWLSEEKVGVSKFVSYGNAMDLNELDLLEYLGNDKGTKVITAYLEGLKGPSKEFMKISEKISREKPIIALKAGKGKKGIEAVSSHTGSLAGAGEVYSAAFKQIGIIEANSWEELFDFAKAFSSQPLPKGNRIAIVTDGGGFGVLATDEAERLSLELPVPSKGLKRKLSKAIPPYGILDNPIDLTGDATAKRYEVVVNACLGSKEFDGVVAITLFQVPTLEEEVTTRLIKLRKKYKKPLLACAAGGAFTRKLSGRLESGGIPVYPTPERAVRAMKALVDHSKAR